MDVLLAVFGLEELYGQFFFCEIRDPQRSEFFNIILMTMKDIKLLNIKQYFKM